MKLEFDSVVIDQFKSFTRAPHELVLSSFGPGLHFVKGDNQDEPRLSPNGCGKSTLWDAICWCLYGRTPAGLRNPDIKARFGKAGRGPRVAVSLKFDGAPTHIVRTAAPNNLTLNGRTVGQDDVEALMGLNCETFTNTLILGQGRPLFYDLKPEAKLDLFGATLNLDRWERRSDAAGVKTRALEAEEYAQVTAVSNLEGLISQTAQLLQQTLASWRGWKAAQQAVAVAAEHRIKTLSTQLEEQEVKRGGFDLTYDGAATELKALLAADRRLGAAGAELILKRSALHTKKAVYQQQIEDWQAELEVLGTTDTCPVCKRPIKGTDLETHKRKLQRNLREVTNHASRTKVLIEALTTKINANQAKLDQARTNITEFQDKANDARDSRDRLTPSIERLAAEIKQLKAGLQQQARTANPHTEQVNKLRQTKEQLEGRLKAETAALAVTRTVIERTKFWVRGFKEVRLYELEDILQELEITTAATLGAVGLVDWQVTYAVEKETKSGTIQRGLSVFIQGPRDKTPVRWECWSGGESQRLRLVGALALSEVLLARAGVEPNFEVLDEPTRGLSPGGIEDLCELLAERAQNLGRMIFYSDHASVESSRFSSVLTVIKDKEGSRLELLE